MRTLHHRLKSLPIKIHFYEGPEDDEALFSWLAQPRQVLGLDTETTGLDIYAQDFAPRLVQLGDKQTAWVIPARYSSVICRAVREAPLLTMHNAPHDLHTMDRHLGLTLEEVHPKTVDTMLLSHILDPRDNEEGNPEIVGHGLKALADAYVDPHSSAGEKTLKAFFKANQWTISEGWRNIPEDQEDYVRYSGLDPIETVHLFEYLWPLTSDNPKLVKFEHRVQRILAKMERKGFLLDVDYTTKLQHDLDKIVEDNDEQILPLFKDAGVAKLTPRGQRGVIDAITVALGGSTHKVLKSGVIKQRHRQSEAPLYAPMSSGSNTVVAAAFLAMGEPLKDKTDSGAWSVDSTVLNVLCDVNKDDEPLETRVPNPLARLVKDAKRAGKWRSSYADTMLEIRDDKNRVHSKIASLKARTARMALSRPPFQQLPSSGRMIRDCLIADPGHLLVAADYDQVEMRLLAAMADEPKMKKAIADGVDLHDMTATILFGPDFTHKQRKAAKNAGFGKVYGGGARTLAKQVGVTEAQAKEVIDKYDEAFPGVKEYSYSLQNEALDNDYAITTPIVGRRLPVDEDRVYAALNYKIQSTARDIFAEALIRLDNANLLSYLLLPVHDEVIGQAPEAEAKGLAHKLGTTMSTTFMGVHLSAKGEIIGTRWGDAY